MTEPNRFAVAGSKGGLAGGKKGGTNRMAAMSDAERTELAKAAAAARWSHPKPHEVVKQMLLTIGRTRLPHRLYKRGDVTWFAEVGHMEEGHWMTWCIGTYSPASSFSDVIEDVVET